MKHLAPATVMANGFSAAVSARPLADIVADLFPADQPGLCQQARLLGEGKARYVLDHPQTANHVSQGKGRPPESAARTQVKAFAELIASEAKARGKGYGRTVTFDRLRWFEYIAPDVLAAVGGSKYETISCLDGLAMDRDAERQRRLLASWQTPPSAVAATTSTWCGDRVPGILDNESRFFVPDLYGTDGKLLVPSVDLWRNDSRRVLPRLLSRQRRFDLIGSDPPYGVGRKDSDGRTIAGDADPRPIAKWVPRLCLALAEVNSYVFVCASNEVRACHAWEGELQEQARHVDRVTWNKRQGSALGDPSSTFNPMVEFLLVAHKGNPKLRPWVNLLRRLGEREDDEPSVFDGKAPNALVQRDDGLWSIHVPRAGGPGDIHPSRKPVALGMRVALNGSDEGDSWLDPFAGCAPFGVAAIRLRRRYVGVECQRDFFAEGVRRLKTALAAMYPEHFGRE